jgi:hypothetical protein
VIHELSLPQLQEDVHQALKVWYKTDSDPNVLSYLQLYRQACLKNAATPREATNRILLNALEALEVDYETEAQLLRKRFLDGLPMHVAANQLNMSEAHAYRKQKEALNHLTLVLQTDEIQLRQARRMALEQRLDLPPQVELVGVEHHLDQLSSVVLAPEGPRLICIDGLGGLGKTTLAHALILQPAILNHFQQLAWISAKQQTFLPGTGVVPEERPALDIETFIDDVLVQLDKCAVLASPL